MQPQLNFSEEDWARIERDTMAWWAGELERPLVYLAVTDPVLPAHRHGYLSNYPLDMPADQIVDLYEPVMAATHFYGDAFPWWWVNFGPGIAAGFLGSQVHSVADPSETVWFSPAREMEIHHLDLNYDAANPWLARVRELTVAITERWQGRVQTGHTDLGGNLDILASFRNTQQLLYEVMDCPDQVERLVGQITQLWVRYYAEMEDLIRPACRGTSCWAPIWSAGRTYMLQCDFSYMISPAMYERFVVPDITICCDYLDHGFYHLDGKGQIPHLNLLLDIKRLRGIQWIPGDGQPSPDQWLPLLKRIRDGGKLCQLFVTPAGARTIVQNLGGKGFLFVLQDVGAEFCDPKVARNYLKTLAAEDIGAQ
jgi:hypothetical protein